MPSRSAAQPGVVSRARLGPHRSAATGMRTGAGPPGASGAGPCTSCAAGLWGSRRNSAAAARHGAMDWTSLHKASCAASTFRTPCSSPRLPSMRWRSRAASAVADSVAESSSARCALVACRSLASALTRSWLACSALRSAPAACRRATSRADACCRLIVPVTSSSTRKRLISWLQASSAAWPEASFCPCAMPCAPRRSTSPRQRSSSAPIRFSTIRASALISSCTRNLAASCAWRSLARPCSCATQFLRASSSARACWSCASATLQRACQCCAASSAASYRFCNSPTKRRNARRCGLPAAMSATLTSAL
mmetsp:Transcript_42571/g.135234  ORF Transcript_42571/g.135234 Transcript_42571/m.135234 type:complete len:309 (+) Transcript_42571:550-1476(+)